VSTAATKRPRIDHDLIANAAHELLLQAAELKTFGRNLGSSGLPVAASTTSGATAASVAAAIGVAVSVITMSAAIGATVRNSIGPTSDT